MAPTSILLVDFVSDLALVPSLHASQYATPSSSTSSTSSLPSCNPSSTHNCTTTSRRRTSKRESLACRHQRLQLAKGCQELEQQDQRQAVVVVD